MARTRFIQAINDALREEMERDEKVILFGEDVEASIFGDTRGLIDIFGSRRVRNTPISENTLTGMTVGTAASGYRVVLHLMFANFVYTGMDGIANQMARARLMSGGQVDLPITIIASYGGGRANSGAALGHAVFSRHERWRRARCGALESSRCQGPSEVGHSQQ